MRNRYEALPSAPLSSIQPGSRGTLVEANVASQSSGGCRQRLGHSPGEKLTWGIKDRFLEEVSWSTGRKTWAGNRARGKCMGKDLEGWKGMVVLQSHERPGAQRTQEGWRDLAARTTFARACNITQKPHIVACRSGEPSEISQAGSDDRSDFITGRKGKMGWSWKVKSWPGRNGGRGGATEPGQCVKTEGLVRWSQACLPTETHPGWKHSV